MCPWPRSKLSSPMLFCEVKSHYDLSSLRSRKSYFGGEGPSPAITGYQAPPKRFAQASAMAGARGLRRAGRRVQAFAALIGLPARLQRFAQHFGQVATAGRVALQAGHALGVASLFWVGALVSRADMHYVSLNGTNDSVNGYITWGGAATNIQWAVNAASGATADTVLVSNGTYNLTNPRVARAVGLGDEIDHMMKVYLGLFKTYKTSDRKFCH